VGLVSQGKYLHFYGFLSKLLTFFGFNQHFLLFCRTLKLFRRRHLCPAHHKSLAKYRISGSCKLFSDFSGFLPILWIFLATIAQHNFQIYEIALRRVRAIREFFPTFDDVQGIRLQRDIHAASLQTAPSGGIRPAEVIGRTTIGTLRVAGRLDGQIHLWMRIPEVHTRHRARERQIFRPDFVQMLGIGWNEVLFDRT